LLIVRRAKLIRDEVNTDGAWYNILQPVTIVEPSPERPHPTYIEMKEDADGYTHLAYFGIIDSDEPTAWLTRGKWEVTKVAGVNPRTGLVYYLSTAVDGENADSTQRHLYSVHLNGFHNVKLTPPVNGTGWNDKVLVPFFNWTDPVVVKEGPSRRAENSRVLPHEPTVLPFASVGFYNAFFTPGCEYYILSYLGPNIPFSRVIKISAGM
jgi:dipeptidyl aminopeptidase